MEENQNHPHTQQLFTRMLEWITSNGGYYDGVAVPVVFPAGEIGVAASKDLPSKTAIMCIPYKVILSVNKSLKSELQHIFRKYEEMFNMEKVNDAQFNILAFYLFFELLKQDKSFYKPYFDCLPTQDFTMMDWPSISINATNLYLKGESEFVASEMARVYNAIKEQIIDHEEIFISMHKSDDELKRVFYKAYNIVMTRCYGWSLPSTCLIPLADMCNHRDKQTSTHYVVHRRYELDPQSKPAQYLIKRQDLDLSLLGVPPPTTPKPKRSSQFRFVNRYVSRKHAGTIQVPPETQQATLSSMITAIQNEQLSTAKHFSELTIYLSSDSEDNDTDEEEKEKRKAIVGDLRCKEVQMNIQRRDRAKRVPKEQEEGFEKNTNTEHIQQIPQQIEKEDSQKSESLEEDNWDWLEKDEHWHFVVTTEGPIKKGQQIYNNYGERTSRFLMMWYGFCPSSNKYDSYSFRVELDNMDKWPLHQLPQHMIFTGWIEQQLQGRQVLNQQLRNKHLSKQFRLKSTRICLDFIRFLRMYLIRYYKDFDEIRCFQIPTSVDYEIFVFEFFLLILVHILEKYFPKQTHPHSPMNHFDIFVNNFKKSQQCIVHEQRNLVRECLNVLVNLKKGAKINDFITVLPIQNLKRIFEYLKELQQFL